MRNLEGLGLKIFLKTFRREHARIGNRRKRHQKPVLACFQGAGPFFGMCKLVASLFWSRKMRQSPTREQLHRQVHTSDLSRHLIYNADYERCDPNPESD